MATLRFASALVPTATTATGAGGVSRASSGEKVGVGSGLGGVLIHVVFLVWGCFDSFFYDLCCDFRNLRC